MADQYINELNDFTAQDGYVVVGATTGNGGGKKLLSEIAGDVLPELPPDASSKSYVLGIVNGELGWVELETDSISQGSSSGPVNVEYKE